MLANMFALLYSKGFGTPEGQVDNSGNDTTQDAHGTGMGEGEGVNDVSDQIDDEDQLLGTFDKVTTGTKLVSHFDFGQILDSNTFGCATLVNNIKSDAISRSPTL